MSERFIQYSETDLGENKATLKEILNELKSLYMDKKNIESQLAIIKEELRTLRKKEENRTIKFKSSKISYSKRSESHSMYNDRDTFKIDEFYQLELRHRYMRES